MFSSLASIADRNFIVGFFLPALIGCLCLSGLFADIPNLHELWLALIQQESFTSLTLFAVGLWGAALILQLMNLQLYRILEGYSFPLNASWCPLARYQKAAWIKARRKLLAKRRAAASSHGLASYLKCLRDFQIQFPPKYKHVLPTAFGNVLRAFETYSSTVYQVDAIPAWPRLIAVIPDSFAKALDSARAEVDFFVNLVFIVCLICLAAFLRLVFSIYAAVSGAFWSPPSHSFLFIATIGFGIFAVLFAYLMAIERAKAWGVLVRSAFDLYLPDLAQKLGFALPEEAYLRGKFWSSMTDQWRYSRLPQPSQWTPHPRSKLQPPDYL